MTYETSSGAFVTPEGWVDLAGWAGRSLRRIPVAIREPDEALTHCDSIVTALGSLGCDPRSGGVAGHAHLADAVGMSWSRFRRVLPQLDFVRDLHGIPVSNVASLSAWAGGHYAAVRRQRLERLGLRERDEA